MKKLKLSLLALLFVTINIFSQEKGIYLVNKKTNDSTFIKENLRTKVVTKNRFVMIGKLKIVDDKTINVDGIDIPIDSVFKIRRASMYHAIADPIMVIVSPVLLLVGLGVALIPNAEPVLIALAFTPGFAALSMPFIKNNHPNTKFNYRIENKEPKTELK